MFFCIKPASVINLRPEIHPRRTQGGFRTQAPVFRGPPRGRTEERLHRPGADRTEGVSEVNRKTDRYEKTILFGSRRAPRRSHGRGRNTGNGTAGRKAGKIPRGTSRASYIFMMIAPLTEPHDGVYREVVFGDNGKDVWFKDPLTHMPTGVPGSRVRSRTA